MDLKSIFGSSESLSNDGVWFDVCEIEPGKQTRFKLAHMGQTNRRFLKAAAKAGRGNRLNDPEALINLNQTVFIDSILLGWENVFLKKGEPPLEFTKENAKMLFKELPSLFELLVGFASDNTNFQENLEENAKN